MSDLFISPEDLVILTGRSLRPQQIAWLRQSGIPFFINAAGRPVVTRAAVEGRDAPRQEVNTWQPRHARR